MSLYASAFGFTHPPFHGPLAVDQLFRPPGLEELHSRLRYLVEARAIGVMRMRDDKGIDDKIIAVNVRDPAVADYHDRTQLPQHVEREIKRFFQDYKVLENKSVEVEDILGPAQALTVLRHALDMYRKLRRGELTYKK